MLSNWISWRVQNAPEQPGWLFPFLLLDRVGFALGADIRFRALDFLVFRADAQGNLSKVTTFSFGFPLVVLPSIQRDAVSFGIYWGPFGFSHEWGSPDA